jgi:polar amino acid transport system substrate-binding protein
MRWLSLFLLIWLLVGCQGAGLPARSPGPASETLRQRGVLRVGVRQDVPQFAYLEPATNAWDGFEVALGREIAADLFGDPSRVELVRVTATQRLPFLRDGSADVVIAQLRPEAAAEVAVSGPYFRSGVGGLVPARSAATTFEEVGSGPFCVGKRTAALDTLRSVRPTATTLLVEALTDCLIALENGQASAAVADLPLLVGLARQAPATRILPTLLTSELFVIGVAPDQPELLAAVNATLARLKSSGRWAALYQQYFAGLLPPADPPA